MISKLRLFFLIVVLGAGLSCHKNSQALDKDVLAILSGFTYVGSGQAKLNSDGSIDVSYRLTHTENEQQILDNIEIGRQYIFHHRVPVDNESLALHDLPDKIASLGFRLVTFPKSANDLLHLYYGGPIFHIKFADDNREYAIFNQVNTSHSNIWSASDYILVRTK